MDLASMKQCTRILQEMLEGNLKLASNSKKTISSKAHDENNNESVTSDSESMKFELSSSLEFHTNSCYSIILDADAESILQNLTDEYFHKCFHLDKIMVRCLLMELHQRTYYHPDAEDIHGLSFDLNVLVTLSYLINGNLDLLIQLREFMGCSSDVLRRCVEKTCQIIVYFLSPVYVRFPCSQEEQEANKSAFLAQFGVPGVLGVLDYYNIGLQNVPEHEKHMYLNRRCQWPSLAVQVICDQNYRFLDVNPRFSGRTHNIHVWRRSHINGIIQSSQKTNPKTWLVGKSCSNFNILSLAPKIFTLNSLMYNICKRGLADRGYHLTSCVINPYRNASDIQQECVNVALKEIQNVALKSFALLKARFRCLNTILPFDHMHATNIITSCVTLHNYLLAKKQPIEDNMSYNVPKAKTLPNARFEDAFSPQGLANREFIKNFMYNNSMQVLYKMRKNSNLSFISDSDQITISQKND